MQQINHSWMKRRVANAVYFGSRFIFVNFNVEVEDYSSSFETLQNLWYLTLHFNILLCRGRTILAPTAHTNCNYNQWHINIWHPSKCFYCAALEEGTAVCVYACTCAWRAWRRQQSPKGGIYLKRASHDLAWSHPLIPQWGLRVHVSLFVCRCGRVCMGG